MATTTVTQTSRPPENAAWGDNEASENTGDRGLCNAALNGEVGRVTELLGEGGFSKEQLASALFGAVSNNQKEVTIAIIQSCEFKNVVDAYKRSEAAAQVFVVAHSNQCEEIMTALLAESVVDPNSRDRKGLSLFTKAITKNGFGAEFTIPNAFIAAGVDVNIMDPCGETPLYCAIERYLGAPKNSEEEKNCKQLVKKLLKAGANPNLKTEFKVPCEEEKPPIEEGAEYDKASVQIEKEAEYDKAPVEIVLTNRSAFNSKAEESPEVRKALNYSIKLVGCHFSEKKPDGDLESDVFNRHYEPCVFNWHYGDQNVFESPFEYFCGDATKERFRELAPLFLEKGADTSSAIAANRLEQTPLDEG